MDRRRGIKDLWHQEAKITGQKVGSVRVRGNRLDDVQITYTGRVLTPTHFSMSPTAPKQGGSYTLKATVIKGQRSTLGKVKKLTKKQRAALGKNFRKEGTRSSDHSPIMLMHTGAGSEDKTQYIPFQRKSKNRSDVEVIKTLSLPQMVSSERTAPNIEKAINEGLEKRMDTTWKGIWGNDDTVSRVRACASIYYIASYYVWYVYIEYLLYIDREK